MKFTLDEQYICDVFTRSEYSVYKGRDPETLTPDELLKVLKGEDIIRTTGSDDHPQFKELRNELEDKGFISCQRGWWNGDRVIKPFVFNGKKFKKDEQFPSASAMKGHLKFMK